MELSDIKKITLVPRFSSFVGARTFNTQPIAVREFGSANITAWRGAMQGTGSPSFAVAVEQSQDLENWTALDALSPSAGAETTSEVEFTMDWMRLSITVAGNSPAVSCWVVGDFVVRANVPH